MFQAVSPEEMRAGQIMTGAALAAFVGASFVPRHAQAIRGTALALYLVGIGAFVAWFMLR